MDWFKTGKGVGQCYILSPCLFNFYVEYIMRNAGLEEYTLESRLLGDISITSDFTCITSHIHNWALFSLWLSLFILSGAVSLLFSSNFSGTYWPGEFIFWCHTILPFHTIYGVLRARILKYPTVCDPMAYTVHGVAKSLTLLKQLSSYAWWSL